MDEYDGHEVDFHAATLWGWRVFRIKGPGEILSPISTGGPGMYGSSAHGDTDWFNPAVCINKKGHNAPNDECSCGYWGIWNLDNLVARVSLSRDSIIARVEMKGKVLLGDSGFRASRIRIVGRLNEIAMTYISSRHFHMFDSDMPITGYNELFPDIPLLNMRDMEELQRKEIDPYDFVPEDKKHHARSSIHSCKCNTCKLYRKHVWGTTDPVNPVVQYQKEFNKIFTGTITNPYGTVTITGQNFTTYTSGSTNNPPTLGNI